MKKIIITTSSFGKYEQAPLELLRSRGFEVILNPFGRKLTKEEVIGLCKGAIGIIAGTETLDAEVIGKFKDLRVISRCGTGLDNIDQDAVRKKRIAIFNTLDTATIAVAELTVGLILNLLRRITRMHMAIINNKWEKLTGNLLYGKKVGVIGFGRIGRKCATLLMSFGCEIAYADPQVKDESIKIRRLSLRGLLAWADIISLHVSGKERVLGEYEISLMKEGALLINTSRGGVVDENALYQALQRGKLCGAALDVFEEEPYIGPLKKLDNVLLTPHIGAYAKETRIQIEKLAVENLLQGLEERK